MASLKLTPGDVCLLRRMQIEPPAGELVMSDKGLDRLLDDCLNARPGGAAALTEIDEYDSGYEDRRRQALLAACVDRDEAEESARRWRSAFCVLAGVMLAALTAAVFIAFVIRW